MTRFQIITLFIFGFIGIGGVLAFSGLLDDRSVSGTGEIAIWGTLPEKQISATFDQLLVDKKINFSVKYRGFNEAEFDRALIEALASGKGPDGIMLSQDLIVHYLDKLYLIPSASYPTRQVYDTFTDEAALFITDQGLLGFPIVVDPIVAYWNKDLFTRAGIPLFPKTWDELIAEIPQLTDKDTRGGITQAAVALGGYSNIKNAKDIISSLLLQSGQSISSWTNDGQIGVRLTANGAGALSFFTQFSDPARSTYAWNSALENSRSMFEAGKLAVYLGRASEYDDIRNKNPHLNFDVAVMPQRSGNVTPAVYGKLYAFAVLNGSQNKSASLTAGSILSSASVMARISESARLAPARRDLLSIGSEDPVLTIFNRSALIADGWLDPNPDGSNRIFKDAVESMLSGQSKDTDATTYIEGQLKNLFNGQ